MNKNNNKKPSLAREIGQLGFAAIALNGMIGAGIFALPAIWIRGCVTEISLAYRKSTQESSLDISVIAVP